MKTYTIATIPGDGIGKEVVPAGQQVLEALAKSSNTFRFKFENFDWGGDYYRQHGVMMAADGLDALRNKDAILFGSAGDPHIPDHITLWGLRLKICQGFDQYANVRPTRILPGIDGPLKRCGPDDLNWVIVRENSEGEYAGVGGRVHQGHPIEAATDVSVMTVSSLRGRAWASLKAKRMMRSTPTRVIMHTSVAASVGWPWWTRPPTPEYSPSEFSRTMTQFRSSGLQRLSGASMPGRMRVGRTLAYWSKP